MTPATAIVLGIDGGGSKTVALLARRTTARREPPTIVGRAVGGPTNPQAVGFDAAGAEIDRLVREAAAAAGVEPGQCAAACIALAGAGRPDDQRRIQQWASERRLARKVAVVADGMAVLAAGAPDHWGIAVIAGTGSFVFGCNPAGATARAGGWGWLLGDEGSGFAIATAALRAVVRAHDHSVPPSPLSTAVMAHLGIVHAPELVRWVYGDFDRARVAALTPVVMAAHAAGDPQAEQIIDQAAADLAEQVVCVARRLDLADRAFPLALAGGVLLGAPTLAKRLRAGIITQGLSAEPVTLVAEPAQGAVRLANALTLGARAEP